MQLIRIEEREGKKLVSGRELHKFLEITERFGNWFDRQLAYGFEENLDYTGCKTFNTQAKQELQDYIITVDMAKEISMIQRTEKGKQARKYFIECEKKILENKHSYMIEDPIERAKAWIVEQEEKNKLIEDNAVKQQIILEYEPKVDYYDNILQCEGLLTITQIAKDYGMSGSSLNKILHEEGIQYKQSKQWLLYSVHANKGYTKSDTHYDSTGTARLNTKWTQKGRLMIHELLKKNDVIALIDR